MLLHLSCVILAMSFYFVLLDVWIKYQDMKLLNVRESSYTCIIIRLLIDLHLYLSESSLSFALVLHLYHFRVRWWSYFVEIDELSCFTYIILRVLNIMVSCFGYEFSSNMMGIQEGYNKNFHIKCIEYYEKFDTCWLFWDMRMVILESC